MKQPLYVPETITGMELLDNFRLSDVQMAFVINEYGEVMGIVTLQDLIEAITGEFHPRDAATSWAVQREDGSWLLDGHIPVPELKDRLGLATVPDEDRGRYHTLSGMLMLLTGRLPKVADTSPGNVGGWRSSTWMARPSTRCSPVRCSRSTIPPGRPRHETGIGDALHTS